jgi:hypothetical protein
MHWRAVSVRRSPSTARSIPSSASWSEPWGVDDANSKLDALLASSSTSPDAAALLADMIFTGERRTLSLARSPPQRHRQKTLEALVRRVSAISRDAPALMILEDAHWADPSSLEALGRLVDEIAGAPGRGSGVRT